MDELRELKGVGEKTAAALKKAGIITLKHLVERYPTRYDVRRIVEAESLVEGEYAYFRVRVASQARIAYIRKNLSILTFKAQLGNRQHTAKLYNQPYLAKTINARPRLVVYGRFKDGAIELSKAVLEKNFDEGIAPIYSLDGVTDKRMADLVSQALPLVPKAKEYLPKEFILKHALIDPQTMRQTLHRPSDEKALFEAQRRMKLGDMFSYLVRVVLRRQARALEKGQAKPVDLTLLESLVDNLPYALTRDQVQAVKEIIGDIEAPRVMRRMLQGDTGSGKTVVAMLAMAAAVSSKHQAAFMAPTDILATQHRTACQVFFAGTSITVALLTASLKPEEKKRVKAGLKDGTIDVVIGTHALFSQSIDYHALGLVITDEQHRFGVNQREQLKTKGDNPDVLYLSATPIPRTLSMTIFGDMDISTLRTRPRNQKTARTMVITDQDKTTIPTHIREALQAGRQVYVVAPTIRTNEEIGMFGVDTITSVIRKRYPKAKVETLHAQLDTQRKQRVLEGFQSHEIDILVATTMVEVGIHVPNATLMVVYHAERFGYAQLHQLRGRVGRDQHAGTCVLISGGDRDALERLKLLETVDDGFVLSEYDLRNRGAGEALGTAQSGTSTLAELLESTSMATLESLNDDAEGTVKAYMDEGKHTHFIERLMPTTKN